MLPRVLELKLQANLGVATGRSRLHLLPRPSIATSQALMLGICYMVYLDDLVCPMQELVGIYGITFLDGVHRGSHPSMSYNASSKLLQEDRTASKEC